MIDHGRETAQGKVTALFIGNDTRFAADSFTAQYEIILKEFGFLAALAFCEQVHGDQALEVPASAQRLHFAGEGDAMYTRQKDAALLIRTADCIPVLFYSKTENLIGAVHAGWRGLEKRILTKTLTAIRAQATGEKYADLEFAVGPCIREQSYEVGNDVAAQFESHFAEAKTNGKFWLNLGAILSAELAALGIAASAVTWHNEDTLPSRHWYSARRGDNRRNLSVIFRTR